MHLFRRSPRKEESAPSIPSSSTLEARPAVFDQQITVPGPITDLIDAIALGDPSEVLALLSNDFTAAANDHQGIKPQTKMDYARLSKVMPRFLTNIVILATATCDLAATCPLLGLHGKPSIFVLVQGDEVLSPGSMHQGLFRVIVNLDGQCRFLERFRPLLGVEADQLLINPAAYHHRMAHDVPRLSVRAVRGDQAWMLSVIETLCRTVFGPDAYAGDAFDLVTENCVLFDGHGDNLPFNTGGPSTCVLRGKEALKTFALESSIGKQIIMAAAAAADTNTAFAQIAMLTMTNTVHAWKNTSWRGILCCVFDEQCVKVETMCLMRTYRPYERDEAYKPGVPLGVPTPPST